MAATLHPLSFKYSYFTERPILEKPMARPMSVAIPYSVHVPLQLDNAESVPVDNEAILGNKVDQPNVDDTSVGAKVTTKKPRTNFTEIVLFQVASRY